MNISIQRCSNCILPGNYPEVDFDSAGVCSMCRDFDAKYRHIKKHSREKELSSMLCRYRGRGRSKYDCLVPFSGGKDSTYTLWLLKNKYGMNPLAFNVDNGFAQEGAQKFLRESAAKLGVDLYTYIPSKTFLKKVYSHAMRRTGEFCTACVVLIPYCYFQSC